MKRIDIVRDTVRRYQQLPNQTIAKYLIENYGEYFKNDLEIARSAVRNVVGKNGDFHRKQTAVKELYRTSTLKLPPTWKKPNNPYYLKPEGSWGIMSDIHIPFHEPKPIETTIQWFQSQKIDGILINGDLFNFGALAYWFQEKRDINREFELCLDFLDFLRQEFPKIPIIFKPGNHEYRLPQKVLSKLPELSGSPITAVETYFGFEERNIEFLEYNQKVMAGKLPVFHGHEFRNLNMAVSPARGLFLKAKTFAACSHCHRVSEDTKRDCNELYLTTWSFGCLCDLAPDWNPFGNDWNWGAGIVSFEKSGSFEVENRRIMPNGKLK